MYASDYTLSLGSSALAITGSTNANRATLKTGWMHQNNNDTTKYKWEWTLSRIGADGGVNFSAWYVDDDGAVSNGYVYYTNGARPVFYLTSDTNASTGDGSIENPFIMEN